MNESTAGVFPSRASGGAEAAAAGGAGLERVALFLLLIVIGVRPLIAETYASEQLSIARAIEAPHGPGPTFTSVLDGLVLVGALLTAAARVRRRRGDVAGWRPTGLGIGLVLATVGAAISLLVASDRRLALNGSTDWLVGGVLCIALVQLLHRPWQVRVALAVLVASGAAFAFQCATQRWAEFPETIADYESHREGFWAAQGVALDDPKVALYERRLYAQEAGGFFPHSNIAGAYLLLSAWAAAALAWVQLRGARAAAAGRGFRIAFGVAVAVVAVLLLAAILLTKSRGALLAAGVSVVGLIGWALVGRVLPGGRVRVAAGWAAVLAVAVSVVAVVRLAPEGSSLGFRWDYWRNTAAMMRAYAWTGVGAENFGKFYVTVKPIEHPEEIADPHNFLVSAFARWGVLGAGGVVALLLGAAQRLTRRGAGALGAAAGSVGPGRIVAWTAALAAGVFGLRLATLVGAPGPYVFYVTVAPLIVWVVAFVVGAVHTNDVGAWLDEPLGPGCLRFLAVGMLAYLLHAMINTAFFYPATATTLFAMLAVALAMRDLAAGTVSERQGETIAGRAVAAWVAGVALAVMVIAHGVVNVWPVTTANHYLHDARRLASVEADVAPAFGRTIGAYRRAISADPLDPTAPTEAAEWFLDATTRTPTEADDPVTLSLWREAAEWAQLGVARNQHDPAAYRVLSAVAAARAITYGELRYARAAVGAAREAVELYPASPQNRAYFADTLELCARFEPPELQASLRLRAVDELAHALALDAARPADELRRWPARVRHGIQARIATLHAQAGAASQPTTAPQ